MVLEAGWRSGALNTVNHALTMGRPVGAVPGPVTSAASAGCHRAIRDYGVLLVSNAHEMAELVGGPDEEPEVQSPSREDPRHVRLLDALSDRAGRTPTDLAARSGMSLLDVHAALATLELHGRVRERERGWVKVVSRQPQ